MTVVAFCPLPLRALSSNGSHGHWSRSAAARKQHRGDCTLVFRSVWKFPKAEKVRISLTFHMGHGNVRDELYRPRDVPNAVAACKSLFDALVDARVIPDDSAAHLELGACRILSARESSGAGIAVCIETLDTGEQPEQST